MLLPIGRSKEGRETASAIVYLLIVINVLVFPWELLSGVDFIAVYSVVPWEITHGADIVRPILLHGIGQIKLFETLQDYQPREPGGRSYAQLGDEFAMTEAAVKSSVQRMRQRHRELLREEVAHTVTRPEEIEEELRHFRAVLGRPRG